MTSDYSILESLAGIYLEDSYVLGIVEGKDYLLFELEAVLTPENPKYVPPKPGEQYCYMESELIFEGISSFDWGRRSFREYRDATGEVDFGNIDSLIVYEDGYSIEGDWGSVRIWSDRLPRLQPPGSGWKGGAAGSGSER